MNYRFTEIVCRPDFYRFEDYPAEQSIEYGLFHFNLSRMIEELDWMEKENATHSILRLVKKSELRVKDPNLLLEQGLDQENVASVDMSYPVILAEIAPDRYSLIDGKHRVTRAIQEGKESVPAYYFPARAAARYLTSEDDYIRFTDYWNSKVEEFQYREDYQGTICPGESEWRELNLESDYVWESLKKYLKKCPRIELYDAGKWFTVFTLNDRVFCGEANSHAHKTAECEEIFEVTKKMIEESIPFFEEWDTPGTGEKRKKEIKKFLKKKTKKTKFLMTIIRVFAQSRK